jgi:hypothetical protein
VSSRLAPLSIPLALLLAASAGAADSPQKVGNFVPFDLDVCFTQAATVEQPVTDVTLQALWILARPLVRECLVDARNYTKSAAFKITLTVTDAGFTRTIDSDGLTATGKKCIDDAVGKVSPPLNPLSAGSKPVTFSDQVGEWPPNEQVRFGINEFSDVTATVRLAMPSLCSCFEPYRLTPDPAPFGLKIQLTPAPEKFKDKEGKMPKPVEVTIGNGPPAPVQSCITDKLSALTYPPFKSDNQVVVPYEFTFLNAVAKSTDVAALPDATKFAQLEVMGVPRGAASQLQLARLNLASLHYNALVTKYQGLAKSDPKGAHGMLKELVSSCKQMIAEHDAYIGALQDEAQIRKDQLAVVSPLKAKDPAWAPFEATVQKYVTEADGLVAKARQNKATAEKICPKVHL